jgi:hypothetical protein
MPISFDYDETRALAKQFRELTGRDIKHTEIIQAMATVKGMKGDSLMHMLKNIAVTPVENSTPDRKERVFFQEKGLTDVLSRELDLPTDPNLITYFMVGIFEVVATTSHSLFEVGVMVRAVMDDLIVAPAHPNTIVGILGKHLVIAIPNIVNIDAVPSWYDSVLNSVSHSTTIESGSRTLEYNLVGAVTDVSGSENLEKALSACKAEIPNIRERTTPGIKGHKWAIVHGLG